jgi:sodium/bile acid cotransporter 3/5
MCPVVYVTILGSFLILFVEIVSSFTVTFDPTTGSVKEGDDQRINFTIHMDDTSPPPSTGYLKFEISVPDEEIAQIRGDRLFVFRNDEIVMRNMTRAFVIRGEFMGQTSVRVKDVSSGNFSQSEDLKVIVRRKQSTISTIFTYSVAILVSLNYINMGCALDMKVVGSVIRHPTAPAVGILSQYIIMPVMSFLLGLWLLADATHLKLGLFVFGCSPAGGASNMWTVLLGGNLDLSITMTFISTILATG